MLGRTTVLAVMFTLLFPVSGLGQGKPPTLRDEVRQKGSAWRTSFPEDLFLLALDQMISRSQIIFLGRVVNEKTRPSADEDSVLTDYTIEVADVYKDSLPVATPGKSLLVTRLGGNLVLEGKPVREDTPTFPPLAWVSPHLFFVSRPNWPGADFQYFFVGYSLGALEIAGDRIVCEGKDQKLIHPITKPYCNKAGGKDQFIQLVKEKIVALARNP
jgi:hypothetical protein